MSVDIVHPLMIGNLIFFGKDNIIRQWTIEACRLIHIVPYAHNAFIQQKLMLLSPPVSHFLSSKVRKCRITGPYRINVDITICIFCKIIVIDPFTIHIVVFVLFHTWVNNGNCLESLFFQVSDQPVRICEVLLIPCEHTIAVHIIYIKIYRVAGNLISSEICRQLPYFCLCLIAPSALMVTKSPTHRQWHTTR